MSEGLSRRTPRVKVIPAKIRTDRNSADSYGNKKRVCAYCRVSTQDESQAGSYQLQVEHYKDFITNNRSWTFQGVYADDGVTGTSTKNRTQFNQMIQDCVDGRIDYIITKSISRFARNTLDCLRYIRELKNLPNPVGVYFEKENIDTLDNKSELFLTILSSMAQEESRSISENTKWGIRKRFQREQPHIPTIYFLGYDTDENGKMVINEEQAAIVRRIFREFLEGNGTQKIAKSLMADGLRTARGNKKWTGDAVLKILKQEKYMGHCITFKTVTIDFLTHKRVANKGHEDQHFIKNHHPAIISEEDFYTVQEELKRRWNMLHDPDNKYRTTHSNRAPFSNKFICGECGRPAVRRRLTSQKDGKKHLFTAWQCRVSSGMDRELKKCTGKYFWEVGLEKTFMKLLYELKEDKEALVAEVKKVMMNYGLEADEQKRMNQLEQQIDDINARVHEMTNRVDARNGDAYQATIRHLYYEQEILQQELDHYTEKMQESIHLERQLDILLNFLDDLEEPSDESPEVRVDIFTHVINKGTMYSDYKVHFELKCGIERTIQGSKR